MSLTQMHFVGWLKQRGLVVMVMLCQASRPTKRGFVYCMFQSAPYISASGRLNCIPVTLVVAVGLARLDCLAATGRMLPPLDLWVCSERPPQCDQLTCWLFIKVIKLKKPWVLLPVAASSSPSLTSSFDEHQNDHRLRQVSSARPPTENSAGLDCRYWGSQFSTVKSTRAGRQDSNCPPVTRHVACEVSVWRKPKSLCFTEVEKVFNKVAN